MVNESNRPACDGVSVYYVAGVGLNSGFVIRSLVLDHTYIAQACVYGFIRRMFVTFVGGIR